MHPSRRTFLVSSLAGLAVAACKPFSAVPAPATIGPRRPNFLVILSDDQRYDTLDYVPRIKARIFDQGVAFSRGYATTPLCGPSRASILTGMYAHDHNVHNNYDPLEKTTFVKHLHAAGYYTGIVGKYLNSWDGAHRPEFDFWAVSAGHGAAGQYFNPPLNINGVWRDHSGYKTYVLRDYALEFLRQASRQTKPFMLLFAPNAPHAPSDPAPGDEALYSNLPPYRPPSFNEPPDKDQPAWMQAQPAWTEKEIHQIDQARLKHLQSLNALDQSVESLLNLLEQQGQADGTMVIYLSDNAIFWGEHRLAGKAQLYEEAVHVPFALRYPPLAPRSRVENRLVANIDIAPTLYQAAGIPIPPRVTGRSLVPLLEGTDSWRNDLLLEAWATPPGYADQEGVFTSSRAIRTERYAYIATEGEQPELYDMAHDPYQLRNQAGNLVHALLAAQLRQRLNQVGHLHHGDWVALCTSPAAPLDAEQVTSRLGRKDLRIVEFDCAQSWLYPAGGKSPGWVALPDDMPPWAQNHVEAARLYARYERTGSSPPFRIYEEDGRAAWFKGGQARIAPTAMPLDQAAARPPIDLPVSFEGAPSPGAGLTLVGYRVNRPKLAPGEVAHLETTWRVDRTSGELLSVMAHVLDQAGRVIVAGDGMGVPIEGWHPGDVFVQRHTLTLPMQVAPGAYWIQTGVYWLDGRRWPVRAARATGDRALLVKLEVT